MTTWNKPRKVERGCRSKRMCGGLEGVLRSTHIAQHHRQSRVASCLGRRHSHRPLHLRQGLVILFLVEIDIAQNYVAKVQVEGQSPSRGRQCRLQRLVRRALLRQPLPQVAESQKSVDIDETWESPVGFLQRGNRLSVPPHSVVGPAQLPLQV